MRQPTLKYDIKRIALAAILSFGMVAGPVPALAEGELSGSVVDSDETLLVELELSTDEIEPSSDADVLLGTSAATDQAQAQAVAAEETTPAKATWNDAEVSEVIYYFFDSSTGTLTLSGTKDTGLHPWVLASEGGIAWQGNKAKIKKVVIKDTIVPVSTEGWFEDCTELAEIEGLSKINTVHTANMSNMFKNCAKLTTLDLSSFVTEVRDIKDADGSLVEKGFSTFMADMFDGCDALQSITLAKGFYFNNGDSGLPDVQWAQAKYNHVASSSDKTWVTENLVAGWNDAEDDVISGVKKNNELAGTWTLANKTVTVTLKGNGGTTIDGKSEVTETFYYNTTINADIINPFTRDGYEFDGWKELNDQSGWLAQAAPITLTENTTFTAEWKAKGTEVKITYIANDGTDSTKDVDYTIGEKIVLPTDTFTREGYVLVAWVATDGTVFTPGDEFEVPQIDKKLTAKWMRIEVVKSEGTPDVTIANKDAVARGLYAKLMASEDLTAEQKAALTDDTVITIYLESHALNTEELKAREADVNAINTMATARGASQAAYFDLKFYYKVGDAERIELAEPGFKVAFKLVVPAEMVNKSTTVTRTFYLFRAHNGEAQSLIEPTTETTFTAESDLFSTYSLAYSDKAKSTGTTSSTKTTTTKASTTTRSTTPNTGDNSLSTVAIGAIAVVGVGAVGYGAMRRRRN